MTAATTEAHLVRACQVQKQKLDRLRADYERLAKWASDNAESCRKVGAVKSAAHVHEWEPVGMTTERRLVSQRRRDWYVAINLAVRSCKCGATEVYRVT